MIEGMHETQGHDVVIKESKARGLPIGVCLSGTILGLGLLIYAISHREVVVAAVAILAILIVLPAALYLFYRAIRDQPALVIGKSGFTDHASITGVGYVGWDEVAAVRLDRVWVAIKLRDPRPVISRQPAWRRALMRMNSKVVTGDIIIPTNALSMPPRELLNLMIERLQRSPESEG